MTRLKSAWNLFLNNKDPTEPEYKDIGVSYSVRPDRPRLTPGNERSIINSVFNRIAIDAASVKIQHVRLDDSDRYVETIESGLNYCLTTEANIDQTGRALIQDIVMSMLDEGVVAVVPTAASANIRKTNVFDVKAMRTGKILEWYPQHVKIRLYDDRNGQKKDVTLPKVSVAIIENPLYAVINERNSTLQRLIRKLNLLDVIDEQSGSGKLDLILQLPYVIKRDAQREQAEKRRKDIENQLANSKFGVAYTDGTEKIVQLNRPIENNLMSQIEYLTSMLYSQLGISQEILSGVASDQEMLNYNSRTIEPILSAITDEFKRKFLTKTARTHGQSIKFFIDPFRFVSVINLANIADVLSRNAIIAPNEFRPILGLKPSEDPNADMLQNRSMPAEDQQYYTEDPNPEENIQYSALAHHGVEGQKWGIRNGPPYPLDKKSALYNKAEHFNDFMNTKFEYGVIYNGKHLSYDNGELDNFDWDNCRTIPIETMKKEKIGTCWDFVNYQHDFFKKNNIPDKSYLYFAQRKDNSFITHTFSVIELDGQKYWFESSFWDHRGLNQINNADDVYRALSKSYGPVKYSFIEEYDPEGMDQNLSDKEFINRIIDK